MTVQYDPFSPEALADPLLLYRELREEAPCYFIEARNTWAPSPTVSLRTRTSAPRWPQTHR